MKIHTRAFASRPLATLLALALLFGSAACVSKPRYDDAIAELRYYQRLYQDLESYQGKLEADNTLLEGTLDLYEGSGPIEAGATADIDARMSELSAIAERIGAGVGEVTVLNVDGGYGLRMPDAILFESGSSDIRPSGRELLLKMAAEIKARPYAQVWVRGHTDSDPIVKAETKQRYPYGNLQLSAARALEVAQLLKTDGGLRQIVVAGFGASEPVASNSSAADKKRNRRVEIFVLDGERGSTN